MATAARVGRLLRLIQVLRSGRSATAEELADQVGVSRRTVFRDLELLQEAGLPFEFDHAMRRYAPCRPALLPPVSLSHDEALALILAAQTLLSGHLIPNPAVARSAALKLESMLPEAMRGACDEIAGGIELRKPQTSDPEPIADLIERFQCALLERKKVRVHYNSYFDGSVIDVVVHPYRLAFIKRGWYLVAFSELHDEVRTFKLERVQRCEESDAAFEIGADFKLDDYFGNAWLMIRGDESHHVVARFSPMVAGNVDEVIWHKTQRTRFEPDGSLRFEVDVDGIEEIRWWILGYGDQAEVLAPPALRTMVAKHAHNRAELYSTVSAARKASG